MAYASRACLLAVCLAACATAKVRERSRGLGTESYLIPSGDPGIELYVRNKHAEGMTAFSAERTILYVHGATSPGEATFDLPVDGVSWMDYLARHGYDVYLVDVRGYGRSTRPSEFDEPPERHPPIVTTDVAVHDLGAAIDHVLARRGIARLDLIGWSWGGTIAGTYAAEHGEKLHRLVLYAPQWVVPPAPASAAPLGAYRAWTPAAQWKLLQTGVPADRQSELLPDAVFELWAAAVLDSDPVGARQAPPVVRSPNGIFHDSARFWRAGKASYDPSRIHVPTLLVRGEWDGVTPTAAEVFRQLTGAPERRYVEIGAASHLLFIEKHRMVLFEEVQAFLDAGER
jgi:pimeloyl-ACP methyl ester carboxylesterase